MTQRFKKTPKPRSVRVGADITRLPRMVWWRRVFRKMMKSLCRLLVATCLQVEMDGEENLPRNGPAIIVSNHLGDADMIIGIAIAPRENIEVLAKSELNKFPALGLIMDLYGVIWVHRGQPDRRALRAALHGLEEERIIALAPEGRESLTGSLEEGTGGAAYLALKANVPIIPVTVTGTENSRVYGNLKRFRRTQVTLSVGVPFDLKVCADRREGIRIGTEFIMKTLASQLPPTYRGSYS
jgi:1-acyl-sn-glycerol-3-phosphate acyltransferase